MGKVKTNLDFSKKFKEEDTLIEKALKKAGGYIIAETKAANSYLVIADKNGKVKKIPAKDL